MSLPILEWLLATEEATLQPFSTETKHVEEKSVHIRFIKCHEGQLFEIVTSALQRQFEFVQCVFKKFSFGPTQFIELVSDVCRKLLSQSDSIFLRPRYYSFSCILKDLVFSDTSIILTQLFLRSQLQIIFFTKMVKIKRLIFIPFQENSNDDSNDICSLCLDNFFDEISEFPFLLKTIDFTPNEVNDIDVDQDYGPLSYRDKLLTIRNFKLTPRDPLQKTYQS